MSSIRAAAVIACVLSASACSDDGGSGGTGGSSGAGGSGGTGASCASIAELTASPTANPTSASAGDTITVTVPANISTTFVRVQLQSSVDGQGYGDGEQSSTGGATPVLVTLDAATPAGTLFPFVQVYECGETTISSQYVPDFATGGYSMIRSNLPANITPTSFIAPVITVQ